MASAVLTEMAPNDGREGGGGERSSKKIAFDVSSRVTGGREGGRNATGVIGNDSESDIKEPRSKTVGSTKTFVPVASFPKPPLPATPSSGSKSANATVAARAAAAAASPSSSRHPYYSAPVFSFEPQPRPPPPRPPINTDGTDSTNRPPSPPRKRHYYHHHHRPSSPTSPVISPTSSDISASGGSSILNSILGQGNNNNSASKTAEDDGLPSPSAYDDLVRSLALIEDERHLIAYDLYRDAKNRIDLLGLRLELFKELKLGTKINVDGAGSGSAAGAGAGSAAGSPAGNDKGSGGADVDAEGGYHVALKEAELRRKQRLEQEQKQQQQPQPQPQQEDGKGAMNKANNENVMDGEKSSGNDTSLAPTKSSAGAAGHHRRRMHLPVFNRHHGHKQNQQQPQQEQMAEEKSKDEKEYELAKSLLDGQKEEFDQLEKRALLFQRAKENLTIDDDWTLAQTLFGITTYYRRELDSSLSIKLEGELIGIPLFEQMSVLRECDLYHTWAPFCIKSRRLAQLGRVDVVGWFITGVPLFGLKRDACFRAIGCDCMREDGSIMLVAEGLKDKIEDGVKDSLLDSPVPGANDGSGANPAATTVSLTEKRKEQYAKSGLSSYDDASCNNNQNSSMGLTNSFFSSDTDVSSYLSRDKILDTIELPPIPTKFGTGRMTIRSFQAVIDVLSPTSARTRIVANVDPNLKMLPQSLIDFCMKKMCGVMLSRLQHSARKILKDPIRNPHARRMRDDVSFYRDWLLPKFQNYCYELGWEMPPVSAFNVKEEDLDEEELILLERRSQSFGEGFGNERPVLSPTRSTVSEPPTRSGSILSESRSAPSSSGGGLSRGVSSIRGDSSLSGETHFSNPIKSYLADWEARAAAKKERDISAARRRAARRLRPQPFTDDEKKRLEELKHARTKMVNGEARSKRGFVSRVVFGSDVIKRGSVGPKDDSGHKKDWFGISRFKVDPLYALLSFFVVLFIVLYSDLMGLYQYLVSNTSTGHPNSVAFMVIDSVVRSILTIGLLFLYAFMYWLVLKATLLFAFDHIEMGQKSGVRGRKLYAKAVRSGTKLLSGGIAFWSTVRALVIVLLRMGIYQSAQLLGHLKNVAAGRSWTDILAQWIESRIPSEVGMVGSEFWRWVAYITTGVSFMFTVTVSLLSSVMRWIGGMFLFNNPLALVIGKILSGIVFLLSCVLTMCCNYVERLVAGSVDGTAGASWRRITIDSTRFYMSYTAFFLLAVLVLANSFLPPKKKRRKQRIDGGLDLVPPGVDDAVDDASSRASNLSRSQEVVSPTGSETVLRENSMGGDSVGDDSSASASSLSRRRGMRAQWSRNSSLSSTGSGDAVADEYNSMRMMASRDEVIYEEGDEGEEEEIVAKQTTRGLSKYSEDLGESFVTAADTAPALSGGTDSQRGDIMYRKKRRFRVKKLIRIKRKTANKFGNGRCEDETSISETANPVSTTSNDMLVKQASLAEF